MKSDKKTSSRKRTTFKAGEMPAVSKILPPRGRSTEAGKIGASVAQTKSAAKPEAEPPQPSATSAEPVAGKRDLHVPPLLLEGDEPTAPSSSGPGQRYALGPTSPPEHGRATGESSELPEAYGTKK
jgi:hypothetical protein